MASEVLDIEGTWKAGRKGIDVEATVEPLGGIRVVVEGCETCHE